VNEEIIRIIRAREARVCECCGAPIGYEDFLGCWIHADGEDHGHNVETSHGDPEFLEDAS
jgi:hypothetical protein